MRRRGAAIARALLAATLAAAPGCKRDTGTVTVDAGEAAPGGPQPELVVQAGFSHFVRDLEFSPDGRLFAAVSVDGLLKVFDVRSGKERRTYVGAAGPLYSLSWSPDGRTIAAAGFDKSVHLWDVASGAEIAVMPGHSDWVFRVEFSPDGRFIASNSYGRDKIVAVWDVEKRSIRHALQHDQEIKDIAWSRDGKTLVALGVKQVEVWNVEAGGRLGTIDVAAGDKGRRGVRFSPDGALVAIDAAGPSVHVYDARSWMEVRKIGGASLVGWAPAGEALVVHEADQVARVEARTGRRLSGWRSGGDLRLAELARDGKLAAVAEKMDVHLFDPATGARLRTLRSTYWKHVGAAMGNATELLHVAWSPNAPVLATAGFDGVLRVFDLRRSAAPRAVVAGPKVEQRSAAEQLFDYGAVKVGLVTEVAFSPDGSRVVTHDAEGVSLWNPRTLARVRKFAAPGATAHAFTTDGKQIAVAHADEVITIFDVATGEKLRSSKGGALTGDCQKSSRVSVMSTSAPISGLRWSPDRSKLSAIYSSTSVFAELDATTFAPGKGGCAHRVPIEAAAWSEAGDKVAVGGGLHMLAQMNGELGWSDNKVHVFSTVGDNALLYRLDGHGLMVLDAAFSRDGSLLATASADRTARLWDAATGAPVATLAGHAGEVDSVAFSHDGRFLATASYDLSVKLWDLQSKREVATIVTLGQDGHVIETPDHYYTASRQGFESVSFRLGESMVPVELFDLRLNRPDLVLARFGYAPPDLIELYHKAYKRRLRKMRIAEEALRPDYRLPTARIVGDVPVTTADRRVALRVAAERAGAPLDRLQVYVNDVPIFGSAGVDLRGEQARSHERTLAVELLPGRNKIQVGSLDAAGTESLKDTVEVISTAKGPSPDLYVVAVGVSRYADARMNLKYAAKDARDIGALFKSRGARFGKVEVLEILDGEARKENILAARERLSRSRIDDQVVVFVAGHGMLDAQLDYYFVTHDFERERPKKRGLTYDELEGLLDGIPARRKLMLIDTCHSGEVDEDAIRTPPPPPGGSDGAVRVTSDFRTLSYDSGTIQSPDRSADLLAQLFADLRRGSGAAVISSASGAEFALESAQWQNGVFTYSVLQGLMSGRADLDGDGAVVVSELREYVVGEVQRLTAGAQTPTARRENLEFDFPVL